MLRAMRRVLWVAGWVSVCALSFTSCSASEGGKKGGAGTGGGGGGAGEAGTDAAICALCTGNTFTPCIDGVQGTPVECPAACSTALGCVECLPNQDVCVGNEVRRCAADGQSAPDLVQTCDLAAGQVCSDGKCTGACQIAEEQPSNVGCEFWAVDLDQQDFPPSDPASAPWGVVLSNASELTANVTIEINEAPVGQPLSLKAVSQVTVSPSGVEAIVLPTRELDCGVKPNDYASPGTCVSSNAFRITSSAPIVVYQFNVFENAFSNDASLLLPTSALGSFHRIINWGAGHPFPTPLLPQVVDRSYVTIVGVTPNTEVRIRPSFAIKGNPPIAATPAGGEIVYTIGPFDVLNLETDDGSFANPDTDLTGTVVLSSAPVAVFSGVETAGVPGSVDVPEPPGGADSCCLDHLEEQMFPVESLGKNYVMTRSPIRSTTSFREPDVIRFLGIAETAQVKTSLPPPYDNFTLAPGQSVTTWTQHNVSVESTTPIMIGQLLVSQGYVDGPALGDPSLTVFPPVEQYRTEYVIMTPGSWTKNYVVIAAEVGSDVTLDGKVAVCPTEPAGTVSGVAYESRVCPLQQGAHKLTGAKPFGIIAYGYGTAGSYAFAGGANVKKIYEPPPVR